MCQSKRLFHGERQALLLRVYSEGVGLHIYSVADVADGG